MDDNQIRENFANNIVRLRKSKKLNQAELANKLNYSDKAISKWENKETMPDITTLYKIADFFNIKIDDLISNKNVIKLSNQHKNHIVITTISVGIAIVIGFITFFFLEIFNVNMSYLSLISTVVISSITLIVFSALWFKKSVLFFSISLLIWSSVFLILETINYDQYILICLIGFIINVLFGLFMTLLSNEEKQK